MMRKRGILWLAAAIARGACHALAIHGMRRGPFGYELPVPPEIQAIEVFAQASFSSA